MFLTFLTLTGQQRELTVVIQNIESFSPVPTEGIEIELTNQGFANLGEQVTAPVTPKNERITLLQTIIIQSDSTTLKIYFNKHGYIEIENLHDTDNDTLLISSFTLYPDCLQKGKWIRKTTFDNDANGETDFWNYEEVVTSKFNLKKQGCSVPDSITLVVNGIEYYSEVEKQTSPNQVKTGFGYTRKFLIGDKKYFHFKEVELELIRRVKIEL